MSPLSELQREILLKQAQDVPLPDDEEEVDWSPEPEPDERTTQCETDLQTCLKTAADKDAAREEEMKKLQARFTKELEERVAEKDRLASEVIGMSAQTCNAEKAQLEQTIADFQRKIADHLEMKDVYIARMERATGKVDDLEKTIAEQKDYIQKLTAHTEGITQLFQVEYQKVENLLRRERRNWKPPSSRSWMTKAV